jgi:sulfur-oxidizing protein SoxY
MIGRPLAPWPSALSRRRFLGWATTVTGLGLDATLRRAWSTEAPARDPLHWPVLNVPSSTSNGARVPIRVELAHPMDPDHHVTSVQVVNPRDPVPVKGVFHFTPLNGRAYVAFQARLDEGRSTLNATSECTRHGRFASTATVTILDGAGGCAGVAPAAPRLAAEIRDPVIRLPHLIAERTIHDGDIIDVQVKIRHPNRTGLALRDGKFVQESEPFHLEAMDVFYGADRVSRFVLGAALSDNPLIAFTLRARLGATVRVTLTNTRRQRFEATHRIPSA